LRAGSPGLDRRSSSLLADVAWDSSGDVRERVLDEDRYFFFGFAKALPKSGFTWQFWILPTHIESSWRPWWFVRERKILPAGVTTPRSFVSSASLMPARVAAPFSIAALNAQSAPAASPSKLETGRLRR